MPTPPTFGNDDFRHVTNTRTYSPVVVVGSSSSSSSSSCCSSCM